MAHIKFDGPRRLTFLHYLLIFITSIAASLAFYVLWPTPYKHEPVRVIAAPQMIVISKELRTEEDVHTIASMVSIASTQGDVTQEDGGEVDEADALPQYGAAAMGADGAWDGKEEPQEAPSQVPQVAVESAGSCVSVDRLSATEHRELIARTAIPDNCRYSETYKYRYDLPPREWMQYRNKDSSRVLIFDIERFLKDPQWSISEFEALSQHRLAKAAMLSLYLLLRDANSPSAYYLLGRSDENVDRGTLDAYLSSGECDYRARQRDGPNPFCLWNK